MSEPELRRIAVTTSLEFEEIVAEILVEVFEAASATWHDLETGESTVSVYVTLDRNEVTARRRLLRKRLTEMESTGGQPGELRIRIGKVKPRDWAESWKRHFKPIDVAGRLLIKPSWSRRRPRSGQSVIILDPGLSFGTGQHPTTSFCLSEIVRAQASGTLQSFLDIGTGTGVLAIAAEKLGYAPVRGFDFDPVAVRIASENAAVNHCERVDFTEQDLMTLPSSSKATYDVVCANLIYDVLLNGKTTILNQLKPTGLLVLAGILTTQFQAVASAYQKSGWLLQRQQTGGEWTSGAFRFDEVGSHC